MRRDFGSVVVVEVVRMLKRDRIESLNPKKAADARNLTRCSQRSERQLAKKGAGRIAHLLPLGSIYICTIIAPKNPIEIIKALTLEP